MKDADPEIKVTDSGLASLCWGLLMVNEFFEEGREKEAFEFYKNYFRHQYGRMADSVDELKYFLEKGTGRKHIEKANYLLPRIKNIVDIINFHYYEPSEFFPYLISYIRKRVGDIPLMNNELGVRIKEGTEKEKREKAAEELVKKLTLSVFYNLKSAIIFPFSNPEHNIIGLGDERRKPIEEMIYAFKTSLKFLNHPLRRIQN